MLSSEEVSSSHDVYSLTAMLSSTEVSSSHEVYSGTLLILVEKGMDTWSDIWAANLNRVQIKHSLTSFVVEQTVLWCLLRIRMSSFALRCRRWHVRKGPVFLNLQKIFLGMAPESWSVANQSRHVRIKWWNVPVYITSKPKLKAANLKPELLSLNQQMLRFSSNLDRICNVKS